MPAARYWRMVGFAPFGRGAMSLSEVVWLDGETPVVPVSVASSFAPLNGAVANLSDGDTSTSVGWGAITVGLPSFAITWDFGVEVNLTAVDLAGNSHAEFPQSAIFQTSSDEIAWVATNIIHPRFDYPGMGNYFKFYLGLVGFEAFVLSKNPLAYWPLNELGGSIAYDWGPNGYHAEYQNSSGVSYGIGPPLRAGRSNSNGFGINAPSLAKVAVNNTAIQTLSNTGNSFTIIMFHRRVATTTQNILMAYWWSAVDGWARYRLVGGGGTTGQTPHSTNGVSGTFGLNETVGIAWKKDVAAQNHSMQINGVKTVNTSFTDPSRSGTGPLEFPGAAGWDYYPARGWMSDVMLFNYAMPDEDVNAILSFSDPISNTSTSAPFFPAAARATPQSISEYPVGTTTLQAPSRPSQSDVQDGGTMTLVGTVKRVGEPANVPLRRRVRLYHERDRRFIRETWSEASTGTFSFPGLKQGEVYTAMAYDHENIYRALVIDAVTGAENASS